jgi:hypothetical protein
MELIKKIGLAVLGVFATAMVAVAQATSEIRSFFQKD